MNQEIYPVYGALARPPMVMGVPLTVVGLIAVTSILCTLIGFILFGGHALLIMLIPIPLLLALRQLCVNDDQAVHIIGYEILCFFRKKNAKFFNNTFTVAPDKQESFKDTLNYFRYSTKRR